MSKHHHREIEDLESESTLEELAALWEKHGMRVLLVLLVVVVVYTGVRYYNMSRENSRQQFLNSLEEAASPDSLRNVAQEAPTPALAALAYLRGGDMALAKAVAPKPAAIPATQPGMAAIELPAPTAQERKAFIDDAGSLYQNVVDKEGAPLLYKLNAKLGLAAVAESRSDWAAAGKLYQEVMDGAGSYSVLKAKAEGHLEMLKRLSAPVPFAPEPAPVARPGTMPNFFEATQPAGTQPATQPTLVAPVMRPAPQSQPASAPSR